MGMQLPGGLVTLLQDLGYNWPEADETKLAGMGHSWLGFTSQMSNPVNQANSGASGVWSQQQGQGVQAFQGAWNQKDAPHTNLLNGTTGGNIIGAGLMICGGIALALKINVIAQLVSLVIEIAQAAATSGITFGGSLLEIPIFKEITSRLINLCISLALNSVMGG